LELEDFTLLDEGKPQHIKYFARQTDSPLSIAIAADVSRSQEAIIQTESRTAAQFLSHVLRDNDKALLVSFGSQVKLLQDYTRSPSELTGALDRLSLDEPSAPTDGPPRGTLLYEALDWTIHEKLFGRPGRKVMVVITDGIDQGSSVTRRQVIESAHRADTVIYAIYHADRNFQYLRGGDVMLQILTEQTGGRFFRVGKEKKQTLGPIFEQIEEEMRNRYLLSYTLSEEVPDGTFRSLEIRTRNTNLKVVARKGYYTGSAASAYSRN
jgi:Ca-activated chloride channel family protein